MNAMVATGAAAIADGTVVWPSDTIQVALADNSFTPTYDMHGNVNNAQFVSDVSSSFVGPRVTLTGKTNVAGILSADNPLFSGVTGNTAVRVWCFKSTGTDATSQLILMYDTGDGFPVVPVGGDISLAWDTGAISGVAGAVQI